MLTFGVYVCELLGDFVPVDEVVALAVCVGYEDEAVFWWVCFHHNGWVEVFVSWHDSLSSGFTESGRYLPGAPQFLRPIARAVRVAGRNCCSPYRSFRRCW